MDESIIAKALLTDNVRKSIKLMDVEITRVEEQIRAVSHNFFDEEVSYRVYVGAKFVNHDLRFSSVNENFIYTSWHLENQSLERESEEVIVVEEGVIYTEELIKCYATMCDVNFKTIIINPFSNKKQQKYIDSTISFSMLVRKQVLDIAIINKDLYLVYE